MYGSPRVRSPTTRFTCGLEQLSFFVFFCGIPQKGVNWQKKIGGAYTSDPPLFSGQARPRPHVLPAFTLRPENGPIIRLTVPAVNAGRQKTSAGTVSPPFRPAPDLTEAPLSDFAVSRTRRKTQLVRPMRSPMTTACAPARRRSSTCRTHPTLRFLSVLAHPRPHAKPVFAQPA